MNTWVHRAILGLVLAAGTGVHAQTVETDSPAPETRALYSPAGLMGERSGLGLPGLRPRLTMSVPLGRRDDSQLASSGPFSWSLDAWQLNTASLAHIQCHRLTSTIDSYLAEDCRFVDQPVPENAVNLVQMRGEWTAAPGLSIGLSAFTLTSDALANDRPGGAWTPVAGLDEQSLRVRPVEGLDLNVSFGIAHDRVGDFLVGLQLARYKQTMSLLDLGLGRMAAGSALGADHFERYANSAELAFGWRRGSFSGDFLASSREVPLYLGGSRYGMAPLNSFDLEFSWRAVRNASITVGVSNLLDASPRSSDEVLLEPGLDDPLEQIFGRIPYVRYKHDL